MLKVPGPQLSGDGETGGQKHCIAACWITCVVHMQKSFRLGGAKEGVRMTEAVIPRFADFDHDCSVFQSAQNVQIVLLQASLIIEEPACTVVASRAALGSPCA